MGRPDAAAGVVDALEAGARQDGGRAQLRLVAQAEFGANRDRVGEVAADAGIGAEDEQRGAVEVVEVVQRQPDLQHPDRGADAVMEAEPGHAGDVGARRSFGQEVVAEAAFQVDRRGVAEAGVERVAADRSGDPLGRVHLVVGQRDERFLVEVEPQVAGGAQPQRIAEVVAEALLDEHRRRAVDGARSPRYDVAAQPEAGADANVTERVFSIPCADPNVGPSTTARAATTITERDRNTWYSVQEGREAPVPHPGVARS